MAAEVSSSPLVRVVNGGADKSDPAPATKSQASITRDFLGGCLPLDSKEVEMDMQVPCGLDKRLDLKSGKVFLERCNSASQSKGDPMIPSKRQTLNLMDDDSRLDLKLFPSSHYQSVCTLDKVKSALERAQKTSNSSRSIRACGGWDPEETTLVAGCPNCLLYVLVSIVNPNCPRCNTLIPLPAKKPRIDLNMYI